jgi:hypothetical protein
MPKRWNRHGAAAASHAVKPGLASKAKLQELWQHRVARLGQRAAASAPNASLPADGGDLRTALSANGGDLRATLPAEGGALFANPCEATPCALGRHR